MSEMKKEAAVASAIVLVETKSPVKFKLDTKNSKASVMLTIRVVRPRKPGEGPDVTPRIVASEVLSVSNPTFTPALNPGNYIVEGFSWVLETSLGGKFSYQCYCGSQATFKETGDVDTSSDPRDTHSGYGAHILKVK